MGATKRASSGGGTSDHTLLTNRDAADQHPASSLAPDTSNFDKILSSADDTVQKALDTVDEHTHAHDDTTGITATNHHDNSNDPTSDEKAALAGTDGSPSVSNKYVTDTDSRNTDARVPTEHHTTHEPGGSDEVNLPASAISVDTTGFTPGGNLGASDTPIQTALQTLHTHNHGGLSIAPNYIDAASGKLGITTHAELSDGKDLVFEADGTSEIGSATNRAQVVHTDAIEMGGTTYTTIGDVTGPASANDNSVAVFNGVTGKIIKELTVAEQRIVGRITSGITDDLTDDQVHSIIFGTGNNIAQDIVIGNTKHLLCQTNVGSNIGDASHYFYYCYLYYLYTRYYDCSLWDGEFKIKDNSSNALRFLEGSNVTFKISTANGAEQVRFTYPIYNVNDMHMVTGANIIPDGTNTLGTSSNFWADVYSNSMSCAKAAGNLREFRFLSSASLRWNILANADAESGSNVGSNLEIRLYDDAGSFIATSLEIVRSSGEWLIGGDLNFQDHSIKEVRDLVFQDGGSTVDIIRDEDNMASDDPNALATQQSIKAYADTKAPATHATQHEVGGSDAVTITHAQTTGQTATDHHSNANDPTSDEKAALAGTGTPGAGNKYVTNDDSRLTDARTPTAHKDTHKSGGTDALTSSDLLEAIVKRLQTSTGPTTLTLGAITDGEYLKRSGTSIISAAVASGGIVSKAIDHTWEGDNNNSREIDLSDDYDLILIFEEESLDYNVDHMAMAYAFKTVYGIMTEDASEKMKHKTMAATNALFQGKMTGADVNKILLGTSGSAASGLNYTGKTYRLIGLKFSSME